MNLTGTQPVSPQLCTCLYANDRSN